MDETCIVISNLSSILKFMWKEMEKYVHEKVVELRILFLTVLKLSKSDFYIKSCYHFTKSDLQGDLTTGGATGFTRPT